jgi:SIR2-like domain
MGGTLEDDLRDRLANGRVVVVAGSGVTAAATKGDRPASWVGLIESGLEHAAQLGRVTEERLDAARRLLKAGDSGLLIMAAEILTESLGGPGAGEYGRWLRETVGSLEAQDISVPAALGKLGVPLATTNYDDLIERVCERGRMTWLKPAGMQRALLGEDDAVAHLHGHWQDPESVILGVRSYEAIVHDGAAQALQQAITVTTTLLFVGIGDGASDPNFSALRAWLKTTLPTSQNRHYRLCLDSEVDDLVKEHIDEAITPLAYGATHAELAGFLEGLKGVMPVAPSVSVVGVSGSPGPAPVALPAPPPTFGRDDEIAQLTLAVAGPSPRPLLLLGSPGIGKTNLTLAVLHDPDVMHKFMTRRWFVRCDAAGTASDLVTQIASTLGLPLGGDIQASIQSFLAQAPALLALDNLETPWEPDTLAVEEVLAAIAETGAVMIASLRGQERPGTVKWATPTLLEPLDPQPARELFLSIADIKFDTQGLDELLQEMGGIPLAIELLAHASEGELDLDHLAQRWQQERTSLLQRQAADHKLLNVAVSIDLSWNSPTMTEPARRLLSLLSELPNGAADEDLEGLLPGQAPAAAACLRRRGLAFDQADRLRVLPPIRHHVAVAHRPNDEDWQRAATHYTQRAIELGRRAGYPGGGQAIARLANEAANLSHIISWALRNRRDDSAFEAASSFLNAARFAGIDAASLAVDQIAAARAADDPAILASSHLALGGVAGSVRRTV